MAMNNSNDTANLLTVTDEAYIVAYAVLCLLVALATVVGNILLFYTVLKSPALRTPTNSLLLSLATADLIAGAIMIPLYVQQFVERIADKGENAKTLCLIRKFLFMLTSGASITSLAVVSVDRMIAVSYPFAYVRKMNAKLVAIIIVTVWSVCLALTSISVLIVPIENWQQILDGNCGPGIPRLSYLIATPTSFYLPGVAILISYIKIFTIARQHRRKITSQQEPSMQPPISQAEVSNAREITISNTRGRASTLTTSVSTKTFPTRSRRITKLRSTIASDLRAAKTVSILVGLFLICWSPVAIFYIYLNTTGTDVKLSKKYTYIHDAFMLLSFLNSAIDPVLYIYLNRDMKSCMKRHVKTLIKCR